MSRKRSPRSGGKVWSQEPKPEAPGIVSPRINSPYPGCCTPYPDARYVNQTLVSVHMHHNGVHCAGYLEPYPLEEWNAQVAARIGFGSSVRGDAR